MNIFYISEDPKTCAEMHVSKHVVKMVIEYAQLMSTAHRVIDGTVYTDFTANGHKIKRWLLDDKREQSLMKVSHINHPSAIWCRKNKSNYLWLFTLWSHLLDEYTYRYGKVHSCARLKEVLKSAPNKIELGEFTQPTPAMPDDVKVAGDSIASYRNYYINNKTHLANWQGKINSRNVPGWYNA